MTRTVLTLDSIGWIDSLSSIDPLQLCRPSKVAWVLQAYGLRPNRRLGQHFLVDRNVLAKLVEAADLTPEDWVLEIGTGLGSLTVALAQQAQQVVTVEKDPRLCQIAAAFLSQFHNIQLLCEDFLTLDIPTILSAYSPAECKDLSRRWKVVANLPYYVSKPIIMRLVETRHLWESAVLTLQKEVADRLKAEPGDKSYGLLTIAVQLYSEVKICGQASRRCFFPPPQVDSTIVRLRFHPTKRVAARDEQLLLKIAEAAFGERRKTLSNALYSRFHRPAWSRHDWELLLKRLGIDPLRRGETLTLQELSTIADAIGEDGYS